MKWPTYHPVENFTELDHSRNILTSMKKKTFAELSFCRNTSVDEDFSSFSSLSHEDPQRSLLIAVLEQALLVDLPYLHKTVNHKINRDGKQFYSNQIGQDAYRWIMTNDHSWPFSFINICHNLELDPQAIRHRVIRLYGLRKLEQKQERRKR